MYKSDNVVSFSTIDHITANQRLYENVFAAGVLHSPLNLSKHLVICCKFATKDLDLTLEENSFHPRISWEKSSNEARLNYKNMLQNELQHVKPPLSCFICMDNMCCNEHHHDDIENYTIDILKAMERAGRSSLYISKNIRAKKAKQINGWNTYVKPYQKENVFWFNVRKLEGKP